MHSPPLWRGYPGDTEWTAGDLGAHIDLPEQTERVPKPIQEKTRVRLDDALPHDTLSAAARPSSDHLPALHRLSDLRGADT
jgi:hypothetical protein